MAAEICITKPEFGWLFGGMGFHNSEATMYKLMKPAFFHERVCKTHREIAPTFSRVFAGYADWTDEAMTHFAEYYEKTLKRTDTTIYAVPGRIPLHETHAQIEEHAEAVAANLDTLVNKLGVRHIRYYCVTNELSVGNTYALLSRDLERFREYHTLLWRVFRGRGLNIGLVATDGSGFSSFPQIDWAAEHMDEITDAYCAHNYETGGLPFDSSEFYHTVYREVSRVAAVALKRQKRFILGEFGIHDDSHFTSKTMCNDVFAGYGDSVREAETALMAVVEAAAAINAGALALAYWSFCDYPDPMLKDWSDSEVGQYRYETGRFSGHGTEIRYNKNGLFRWDDEEGDYSARPMLYSVGLMAKHFKKHARVLMCRSGDEQLVGCAVRNGDRSCSVCLINLSGEEKLARVTFGLPVGKPLRVYVYETEKVPVSEFGDLQDFTNIVGRPDEPFELKLAPHSMVLLTSDYLDRTPKRVDGVTMSGSALRWVESQDEHHCYYRVYRDGKQIASTVACEIAAGGGDSGYRVRDVDIFGNLGD